MSILFLALNKFKCSPRSFGIPSFFIREVRLNCNERFFRPEPVQHTKIQFNHNQNGYFVYLILLLSLTITYQNDYHPALISLTTHVTCCSDQVYLVQHHSNGQIELSDVDSALAYQTEDHPNPQMLHCLRYFVSKMKRNVVSVLLCLFPSQK